MKEKNIKIIFFVFIILLLLIAIYYVVKNKNTLASDIKIKKLEEKIDNNIIIGITDFDTINPIISNNRDIQYISKLIYNPLIDISEDFKLEPSLALDWSSIDKKTYLIKLNEEKSWQNGKKITAEDIKYTLDYIKGKSSIYEDNIKNIDYLEIIDDYTIKIHLLEEEEDFEYMLCFPIICENENVGTGDFEIVDLAEEEIKLKGRDIDKEITIKIYENTTKLYNAFSKGEVDVIITNNINYKQYIGGVGYNEKIVTGRDFDYLKFNLENNKLSNPNVIKAISYVINKSEIIYKLYNNSYVQAEFPIQYGSYLYNNDIKYEYNLNKAEECLKADGWRYNSGSWEKNRQTLKFEITTSKEKVEVAKIIKDNLEEFGIKVTIKEINDDYYKKNFEKLNFEILLAGSTVSIKPKIDEYLNFKIEKLETKKETFNNVYKKYSENPNFIGLYFNSVIIIYSKELKGNYSGNWYNIFYNIDSWYKVENM